MRQNPYHPWKPPFGYESEGQKIVDSRGQMFLDLRGWGFLTGKGSEALSLDEDVAARYQDSVGRRVATILNGDALAYSQDIQRCFNQCVHFQTVDKELTCQHPQATVRVIQQDEALTGFPAHCPLRQVKG